MIVNTSTNLLFTYDLYSPVVDASTDTVVWNFAQTGKCTVSPHTNGDIDLYTKEALTPSYAIRNLRDAEGTNLFVAGGKEYQMFVVSLMPVIINSGVLWGYMHRLQPQLKANAVQVIRMV